MRKQICLTGGYFLRSNDIVSFDFSVITLLLGHWYEIMALYYVKSIFTEISASRQDRKVLQKKQNHQIQISEHIGHATDV